MAERSDPTSFRSREITMRFATAALVLALSSAAPAAAQGLTGHWEGTYVCTEFEDGLKDKAVSSSAMAVTSLGDGTFAAIVDGYKWRGVEIPSQSDPNKGELALINCSSDTDLNGVPFATEFARFKVSLSGDNGSISGISLWSGGARHIATCKYKLKRVDTVNPGLTYTCP
jgi:hypothetical protein